jgi:hypothetical protein
MNDAPLQSKLCNPERSSNFDLHNGVNHVLNMSECQLRTAAAR